MILYENALFKWITIELVWPFHSTCSLNDVIKTFLLRFWESPTFTTWASIGTKTLSLLIVLPLILNRFITSEIALWYLFSTIITIQMLADFGFSATFVRSIAYGMGGAKSLKDITTQQHRSHEPNWSIVGEIIGTMRCIYIVIGIVVFLLMLSLGTLSVKRLISQVPQSEQAWLAWILILCTSAFSIYGNYYSAFLQGTNHVALFRRWETLFSVFSILTSFLVLFFHGDFLTLVAANQGWSIINVFRNRFLCGKIEKGFFRKYDKAKFNKNIFLSLWPPAWRSGIGIIMGYGIYNSTGIIFAQFGTIGNVAMYLFALRLIQTISLFSQAPFYSKLPLLSKLYAEGKLKELVKNAKRGMFISYLTFALLFAFLSLSGNQLFILINSHIFFPDKYLWILFGIGFFIERYGAMHIQIYSLTNNIIWHIVNGITGLIFIAVTAALLSVYNSMLVYPIALIVSYIGFYSWYSACYSYKIINERCISFEIKTSVLPFLVIVMATTIIMIK